VQDGVVPQWIRVGENGSPAVQVQIYQQPSANNVAIATGVREALADYQPRLPPDVRLVNWYDQSTLVTESTGSVRDAILIGLGLAGLVLLAFLRSFRVTLVAMLVVPATLATTVLLLFMLGMSFNIMTLGGLAAAVGLVIDDVITMVEHLARRTGAKDALANGRDAVLAAGREFLPPLTGSSMATLLVFLPLAFLTGVTGAFFKALSLTMAAALIISYGLTALAAPVLTRLIVNFDKWQDPGMGPEGRVGRGHRWLLERLFARPWLLLFGVAPLLCSAGLPTTMSAAASCRRWTRAASCSTSTRSPAPPWTRRRANWPRSKPFSTRRQTSRPTPPGSALASAED